MDKMLLYWSKDEKISQECYREIQTKKAGKYITMFMIEQLYQDGYRLPKYVKKVPTLMVTNNSGEFDIYEGTSAKKELINRISKILYMLAYSENINKRVEKESNENKENVQVIGKKSDGPVTDVEVENRISKKLSLEKDHYTKEHSSGIPVNMSQEEKMEHILLNPSISGKGKHEKKIGEFGSSGRLAKSLGVKIGNDGSAIIMTAKDESLIEPTKKN